MSKAKNDFLNYLKKLTSNKKEVIEGITKICQSNAQHAKVFTEALFEDFREVFHRFNQMNNLRQT